MNLQPLKLAAFALPLLILPACNGMIGEDEALDRRTGGGRAGGTMVDPSDCTQTQGAPLHARMISPSQYNNAVLDTVKVGGDLSKDFAAGAELQLDDLGAAQRANVAADVAKKAVAALGTWSPCAPPAVDAETCETQLIDWIGLHAYRHPLTDEQKGLFRKLFDAGRMEKDFTTGVEWLLTGVLQAPEFLYQFAAQTPGEQPGQVIALSGYEMASRLAFFLWDSTPDDKLYTAASANELTDPALLQQHVGEMVKDARYLRSVAGFYSAWLKVPDFGELARDDKSFTTDVVTSLATSLLKSATELYKAGSPNLTGLFSGETYYLNDTLRAFYGAQGSGDFSATAMTGQNRHGILTHPGFMALLARPLESNPISRGLFIRRRLLCQELEPPAGVKIPDLPPITPGLSTRDRIDEHAMNPACAGCHNQIDPPGYALENFDQLGRYRTKDNDQPIVTSGIMTQSGDLDGAFTLGDEVMTRIATSETVRTCFAKQYFQYGVLRNVADADQCALDGIGVGFASTGDLNALVVSIASSDSFRYRSSEGEAQ